MKWIEKSREYAIKWAKMIEVYQIISKCVDKYDRNVLYCGKDMDNTLRIMEKTYQSTKRKDGRG